MVSKVAAHVRHFTVADTADTGGAATNKDPVTPVAPAAPVEPSTPTPVVTPTWESRDYARQSVRAEEDRLRLYYLRSANADLDPGAGGGGPPTTQYTLEQAAAAIDNKIDPKLGNMDPVLAGRLSNMNQSPTWAGAIPPGSDVSGVWFRNFYLDGNNDPDEPDAQLYTYDRGGTLYTFEIAGSFAQAYRTIDPGLPGSNSRLGLPVSGQEVMQADHPLYAKSGSKSVYYQNFEHGTLVETQPNTFTWYDRNGNVVADNHKVPGVDFSPADEKKLVQPVDWPLTPGSEFRTPSAAGPQADDGNFYHGAKDWFAPAGTTVRAPIDGKIKWIEHAGPSGGKVYGSAVYVEGEDGRVWVFRHVDTNVQVGDRVSAGDPIATVAAWSGGSPHAHVELWKSFDGGYDYENMIDPMTELSIFL
jgi:hypothetical protein